MNRHYFCACLISESSMVKQKINAREPSVYRVELDCHFESDLIRLKVVNFILTDAQVFHHVLVVDFLMIIP